MVLMHDGMCAAIHAKRVTLTDKDLRLVCRFQNNCDAFDLDPTMPYAVGVWFCGLIFM